MKLPRVMRLAVGLMLVGCAPEAQAPPPTEASREALVSPELEWDPPTFDPAVQWYSVPQGRGAFDGAREVIAWSDLRSVDLAVYVAHVDLATGQVAEPQGVFVQGQVSPNSLNVDCAAGVCWVTWDNYFSDTVTVRLDAALQRLDATSIHLPGSYDFRSATDGTSLLLAHGSGTTLAYQRISGSGAVLDAAPLLLGLQRPDTAPWAMVADGPEYVFAWAQGASTTAALSAGRLQTDGGLRISPLYPVSALPGAVQMASGAGMQLVSWVSPPGSLLAARFSDAGWLDPMPIVIAAQITTFSRPALGFDGTDFWAAWTASFFSTQQVARISPAGLVLDPAGLTLADAGTGFAFSSAPQLSCAPGACTAAWQAPGGTAAHMRLRRLNADSGVLDPGGITVPPVVPGAPRELAPSVACTPRMCLAVWTSTGSSGSALLGARWAPDGGVQPGVITFVDGGVAQAAVAAGPGQFGVAWQTEGTLVLSRVAEDGTVLDPQGITTAVDNGPGPALAFDGAQYVATWNGPIVDAGFLLSARPYFWRVSPDGGSSPPQPLCATCFGGRSSPPLEAALPGMVGVLWVDDGFAPRFARIDASGSVLDPTGAPLPSFGIPSGLAASAQGFLVLWAGGFYASRVAVDAGTLDTHAIVLVQGSPTAFISTAANGGATAEGTGYVVAYTDQTTEGPLVQRAQRIGWDGGFIGHAVKLADGAAQAQVAPTADGALVVYEVFDPRPAYENVRLRGVVFTESANGSFCADDSECASGYCVACSCSATTDGGGPGSCDAGLPADAGVGSDGGSAGDAGTGEDAGTVTDAGSTSLVYGVGCGCGASPGALGVLLLGPLARRARRARRAQ